MDLLCRLFILTIFSPMKESKKFSYKCVEPKHFRVSGIKISNVTKETSQILLQTPWHFRKPQINLVSLCGNYFTDVGYDIGQFETSLGYTNRYHCVFCSGLLLKNVLFRVDYLIIKLVIVYRWYENLSLE